MSRIFQRFFLRICRVDAAIEQVGAHVRFLPPYSPDFNPIELAFANASREIVAAKQDWFVDRDIAKFWQRAGTTVYSLLKYFSYLLGHAAGLGQSTSETAPETWALLKRNAWLLPSVERLSEELSRMYETFEEWKSLEVFEPLKQHARSLFADCGIRISDRDGSLYVFVSPGELPLSL